MAQIPVSEQDKSLPQLLGDLTREISLLVHEEVQLAKVELSEKMKRVGAGAAMFAVAAVSGLAALGAFVACMIIALAIVWPLWLAALVIGGIFCAGAAAMAVIALLQAQKGTPPVPRKAMESTKEDIAWLQKQLKFSRR